jgi:trk system potassium uptake protein TrkH
MQLHAILRILGLLLMLFSLTMLPPLAVSLVMGDNAESSFLAAMGLILGIGAMMWLPARKHQQDLRMRDGFLVVVFFWIVLGASGAAPFILTPNPQMSLADAIFESVSGLTTTGATVVVGLDDLPASLLFYRQMLQWLGGMGIIVLAVAILPVLGVGGMQLYRAETPGPMKDNKLTPRITETAKALWYIYLSLSLACIAGYWLAGMSVFDAISHGFSTVAIGGFSTHDASLGYFDSPAVDAVATVFMVLSGINFALHFLAWRRRSLRSYLTDAEFVAYGSLLIGLVFLTTLYLWLFEYEYLFDAFRYGTFQVVSFATTTGFTTSDFSSWPAFLPVLLIFVSFVGGCAGSTGGGLKVIRVLLLFKQGFREVMRLIHPNGHFSIRLGNAPLADRVMDAIWGFFAAYVGFFALLMVILMSLGLDQVTAFSAIAACLNNLGPGLGEVSSNYASLGSGAKLVLSFAMLLGRLRPLACRVDARKPASPWPLVSLHSSRRRRYRYGMPLLRNRGRPSSRASALAASRQQRSPDLAPRPGANARSLVPARLISRIPFRG